MPRSRRRKTKLKQSNDNKTRSTAQKCRIINNVQPKAHEPENHVHDIMKLLPRLIASGPKEPAPAAPTSYYQIHHHHGKARDEKEEHDRERQRVSKINDPDNSMQIDAKNDDMAMQIDEANEDIQDEHDEDDPPPQQKSGLDAGFAKDIDPKQVQWTEETFRIMEIFIYKLCQLLPTKQVFMSSMKLLRRIVNNLVVYPLHGAQSKDKDPTKFRRLSLSNWKLKEQLFRYQPAVCLLLLIGFQRKQKYLVLAPENENPMIFQALVIKIDNCQPPKDPLVEVDKEVKIYEMADVQKAKVQQAANIAQRQAEQSKDIHRQSKELRVKKHGVKQKEYRFTVIRVEFPSRKVLEAKFNPNVPIFKLFEFVESMLDENARKLQYQLKLPPSVVIKNERDENQTFKSMGGVIPACTIRFVLRPDATYNGRFIKQEMVDKYLTTEVTSLRSDKLNNVLNGDVDGK